MNLRERIEDNLTIWLLTTLVTGFVAGAGAYKAILEIAQLTVISKARLEQLEAHDKTIQSQDDKQPPTNPEPLLLEISKGEPSFDHKSINFSEKLPPFPENFELIRPGMRLSEARAGLPNGELSSSGWYSIDFDSGPFSTVVFYREFNDLGSEDPAIGSINFRFRNESARQAVVSAALRDFGGITHRSESLGATLVWPDLHGFELVIDDDSYAISPASKPQS